VIVGLANHLHSKGFQDMPKVDDALRTLLEAIGPKQTKLERVSVRDCLKRVLGEDIIANRFIPLTDRSVMDGYAVRSEDTQNASQENPVPLRIVGESSLGEACDAVVGRGDAVAIATGSVMPAGADAVVIVERTTALSGHQVGVQTKVIAGQNIMRKGDDIRPEMVALKRGHRLRAQDLGLLIALGLKRVQVVKRLKVAIISTGNELVDSQENKDATKITDLNRPILSALIEESGGLPVDLGICRDREKDILRMLRRGVESCDIVMVTAGSSVGRRDLVPKCINMIGKPGVLVHGVAMRPSLPTGLAVVKGKPILSLPGFPVSAIVAFRNFGRPLIAKLMGAEGFVDPIVRASLKERIGGEMGYRTFVRVVLRRTEEGLTAEPLKSQRSSLLMSMVAANGIVTIPENVAVIEAGQVVDVTVIGEIPA
jgi:molybdopterin molybdotransferase